MKEIRSSDVKKSVQKIYHVLHNFLLKVAMHCFKREKLEGNKIVIDNFAGKGFGDNPKYITESLLKLKPNIDIVWLVSDMNETFPEGIRKVKYGSLRSIKELSSAKVWVDNIKNSIKPPKKIGQFYLQTWHGGIGLKAVERMVENQLDSQYVNTAKKDAKQTDLMLSDSQWTTEIFTNWFWYNGPVVKTGFPRNDLLINKPNDIIEHAYKYLGLSMHEKVIMYAPTFRDDGSLDAYRMNFDKILQIMEDKFKVNCVLLIRLHPNIQQFSNKIYDFEHSHKRVFDVSTYPDMQELLAITDFLITDFSSCMFDAMIGGSTVFLLAKDYTDYIQQDRSLLFNLKDLPFSFSKSENGFLKAINHFDQKVYNKNVDAFKEKVKLFEDGKASERVARLLAQRLG